MRLAKASALEQNARSLESAFDGRPGASLVARLVGTRFPLALKAEGDLPR